MEIIKTHQNLVSELGIYYKTKTDLTKLEKAGSSKEAYRLLLAHWDGLNIAHVEHFNILLFNRAQRVLGFCEISKGSAVGTVIDIQLIFRYAILANAQGILLAHNHPSGFTNPSKADLELTKKIVKAGKLMEITILDHLIISPENYLSFADEGLL